MLTPQRRGGRPRYNRFPKATICSLWHCKNFLDFLIFHGTITACYCRMKPCPCVSLFPFSNRSPANLRSQPEHHSRFSSVGQICAAHPPEWYTPADGGHPIADPRTAPTATRRDVRNGQSGTGPSEKGGSSGYIYENTRSSDRVSDGKRGFFDAKRPELKLPWAILVAQPVPTRHGSRPSRVGVMRRGHFPHERRIQGWTGGLASRRLSRRIQVSTANTRDVRAKAASTIVPPARPTLRRLPLHYRRS